MQPKRLVVIGASAGGIEAVRTVVGGLPRDFDAALALVIHTAPQSPGVLGGIVARAGALDAVSVTKLEPLRRGTVYVAAPDHHLIVEPGRVRPTKGPRENRFRPAIDPLFRSAAQVYGPNAIGVILTGNLDDGTAGLWAIKQLGGVAIVQDPDEAMFPSMPRSALTYVDADHVVPLTNIAPLLARLTADHVEPAPAPEVPDAMAIEVNIAREDDPRAAGVERLGDPSKVACPECHGVLLQLKGPGPLRFRCHTGHAYSADSLVSEIAEGVEVALWNAIRSMQEGSILMRQLADHGGEAHPPATRADLMARAGELDDQANQLRALVTSTPPGAEP